MALSLRGVGSRISRSFFYLSESNISKNETIRNDSAINYYFVENAFQSYGEELEIGQNPAVDALADSIYYELRGGDNLSLMTHSDDAFIARRALQDVKNRLLLEDRLSRRETEAFMNKIRVETLQLEAAG